MYRAGKIISTLAFASIGFAASACWAAAWPRAGYGAQPFVRNGEQAAQSGASAAASRSIGTIKSITGNTVIVTTDAGADVTVMTNDATRFVRVAPGQTTLQGATALHLQDLQVGDRVLVRGQAASAGAPMTAAAVIVMKKTDLEAVHAQQQAEWQRGVGGLVKSTDPASGAITITMAALGGVKTVEIHTTKETILRRYAPDSVNFDDAKPGTFDQIHPGDQMRARGARTPDGNFDAQEIVSGAFRNIAGTITAIDTSANTLTVSDVISKKSFLVKFTPQSEIRQLAPQMAQRIAMRLKMGQNGGQQGGAGTMGGNPGAGGPPGSPGQRQAGFQRGGGAGDLQQMLNRLPPVKLGELQKGEAVMIVSTEGATSGEVTAITLLGGVEPILQAPSGAQAMTLSPWSLSAPAEGDDQQP
jgi:Domain of unknown function (DUF5666)